MSFDSLLASQPRATVVDVDDEQVSGGLLGTAETVIATNVPVWVHDLSPADVELSEAGAPTVTATATVHGDRTLRVGWELRLADGRVYVVTGWAEYGNTPRGNHHLRYPVRRTA